jgi:signal transduction histidine kinase
LFGAECAEDLIGLPIKQIVPPDGESILQEQIVQARSDQGIFCIEEQFKRLNGDAFWAEVSGPCITYQGQSAIQTIVRDISARKEAEQHEKELIAEHERVRVLEEFINDVSHDFRTPLTVINTYVYLLIKSDLPKKQRRQLTLIHKHSTRLMQMVEDMFQMFELDLAKDLEMDAVDLVPVLQVIVTDYVALAAEKNQTLHVNVPDTSRTVWGHKKSLEQVVVRLVTNALQFTPEGGTITVQTMMNDHYVSIEVGDTGIGIGEQDMPHIFKRFFRADRTRATGSGGSGLGLTIAAKIVERHQGYIEVSSVVNEGSVFRVVLPRYGSS